MTFTGFTTDTVPFLTDLSIHNDRDWFTANKARYQAALLDPAKAFVAAMADRLPPTVHCEPRVNGSIFRINRDTRFSKDKTPYKDHLDLMFWEGAGRPRECPALFFRLTPTALHLGGGLHGFDKASLQRFRALVAGPEGEVLEGLLADASGFVVGGDKYKRVPKGFDPDHPRAARLKYGGLHVFRESPVPANHTSVAFADDTAATLHRALPVVRWLLQVTEPGKA